MEISLMCNRSNAMTFIRVKVTINFTVRAHQLWQLCGNWRSKALPPPDRSARTPPTASPFRDKGAEMVGGRDRRQPIILLDISFTIVCTHRPTTYHSSH